MYGNQGHIKQDCSFFFNYERQVWREDVSKQISSKDKIM